PKYIQTVVGKGYRFVAEISEPPQEPPVLPVESAPQAPAMHEPKLWIGAAACALVLGAIGAWLYLRSETGPASIGVLPFENLTGSADRQYLADGMTEETIALLGSLSPVQLRVIARTSVMQYLGTRKPVAQIGRELGVGLVLESSLREEGGRVRIT